MGEALRKRIGQRDPSPPAREAMVNLLIAADEVRQRLERVCRESGLTLPQYNVLRILRGAQPKGRSRCEIAERLIERSPDVTRLIDKLEARGLVERRRCDQDRRLSLSAITPAGLDAVAEVSPRVECVERWFAGRVAETDAVQISRICEGVYDDGDDSP